MTAKTRLLRLLASRNSARHHLDAAQTGETRNITISQCSAARFNASCQRSPALSPRIGSRSRNTSFQPCVIIQSRMAMACALLALEWERKIRDTADIRTTVQPQPGAALREANRKIGRAHV